jgi:hypothetical protein
LTVTTIPADRIGLAERREHRDGTGTLTLAVKIGKDSDGDRPDRELRHRYGCRCHGGAGGRQPHWCDRHGSAGRKVTAPR